MKMRIYWKAAAFAVLFALAVHVPAAYARDIQEGQVCVLSEWVGYYEAQDGSSLTVLAVSEDQVFLDGGAVLDFTNQEKTEAKAEGSAGEAASYILNKESIMVYCRDENGVWNSVKYARRKGQYTWLEPQSGTRYWMQANGSVLKNSVTPDGWYVGNDGCWDPYMGMGPFCSGIYQDADGEERYVIRMNEALTIQDWRLEDETDKKVVGLVDYYDRNADGEENSRLDMRLINTMDGYVVVDTAGQIAAYLYPVGTSGQLMVRKEGASGYESLVLSAE